MNIFALDQDPRTAAHYHNNRHVIKMILESGQILSNAHLHLDGAETMKGRNVPNIYSPRHRNYPIVKWAQASSSNYEWLHALMMFLMVEYSARYNKIHDYGLHWRLLEPLPFNLPIGPRTPFVQAMPPQFKRADAVEAYRLYYFEAKQHIAEWKSPATVPMWWTEMQENAIKKLTRKSA